MTEKRFTNTDNGFIIDYESEQKVLNLYDVVDVLNELNDENKELKVELQRIYDVSTVNKVKSIVDEIYDDLLYETSEESDYARKKVLECLEKIDKLGDDFE